MSNLNYKSLLEVILSRYGDILEEENVSNNHVNSLDDVKISSIKGITIKVNSNQPNKHEKNYVLPKSIVLIDQSINQAGDLFQLEKKCKHVLELDLSKNQIEDFREIHKMISSFNELRLVNLSSNPLNINQVYLNTAEYFSNQWTLTNKTITNLILNSCYIDFKIIELLLEKLENLDELHLSSNDYENVSLSSDFCKKSLKTLYFNNNRLKNWNDVCILGKCFPNLEYLSICENSLADIDKTKDSENSNLDFANALRNLKSIVLSKLNINKWTTLDIFREEFVELINVKIQNIPLVENLTFDEKFFLMVSYLGDKIKTINGTEITNKERDTCERKFIRYYMENSFQKPKLYEKLELKHGKLDKLADVNLDESKCNRPLCKIKFGDKQILENIDLRQTVGELKKKLEYFVGQSSARYRLFHIDIEACSQLIYGPEELKFPARKLYTLNIRDGDEFEIDLKN